MSRFEDAERLNGLAAAVGNAIWRLQEVEGIAVTTLVLLSEAEQGMGKEAGEELMKNARRKTFGQIVKRLEKRRILPDDLQAALSTVVADRNWLVHRSLDSSRSAIRHDPDCAALHLRLGEIQQLATAIIHALGAVVIEKMKEAGISEGAIEAETQRTLTGWHSSKRSPTSGS